MNKTHGDILHSPVMTDDPVLNKTISSYQPPCGEVGWICPVCGRGLAPSTSYCPCNLTRNITYLKCDATLEEILSQYINTNTTPPEAHHTATATATATNKCKDGVVYGAH